MWGQLIAKSLLRNPRVSAWTLATMTTCATLVTVFVTASLEVEQKMAGALRTLGANAVARPVPGGAPRWEDVASAARTAGAAMARLDLRVGVALGAPVAVVAADPRALEAMTPYWKVEGRRAAAPGECIAGGRVAQTLHVVPGKRVTVDWTGGGGSSAMTVVGVFESGDADEGRLFVVGFPPRSAGASESALRALLPEKHADITAFAPLTAATCLSCHDAGAAPKLSPRVRESLAAAGGATPDRDAAESSGDVGYALLSVPGGEEGVAELRRKMLETGSGVALDPLRQVLHGEEHVLEKIALLSALSVAVVVALTTLGVSASVFARMVERRRELALFEGLGATKRWVVGFLLGEGGLVAALSSSLGFALGTLGAQLVVRRVFDANVHLHWTAFAAAAAVTLVIALATGALAGRFVVRLAPAAALRGE